jgi:hypothetical protein
MEAVLLDAERPRVTRSSNDMSASEAAPMILQTNLVQHQRVPF